MQNGLQPAITKCFYCHKDKNEILLGTILSDNHQDKIGKMHGKVISMEPCQECESLMGMGVIIITIDDEKSEANWHKPPSSWTQLSDKEKQKRIPWMPNPYRTGGWFVLKDEAITKMVNDEGMAQWALDHRFMFMEEEAARNVGLYDMEPVNETPDAANVREREEAQ